MNCMLEHSENRDRLIHILESAVNILKPSQFFAWTQGPLQALLPHEILVCGMAEGSEREFRLRYFSATRYFKAEHFEAACNPQAGLFAQVIDHWRSTRRPCVVPAPVAAQNCHPLWESAMQRLELRNMASHGQISSQGQLHAWFGFFRVANLGHQTGTLLELLLPSITATYARVLSHETVVPSPIQALDRTLSPREMQVLELIREGCSNQEIAVRLTISPITAKNHVQNIRFKLKARTRGQAVAEALRLVILRPQQEEQ